MTALDDRPAVPEDVAGDLTAALRANVATWRLLDQAHAELAQARGLLAEERRRAQLVEYLSPYASRPHIEGTQAEWLAAWRDAQVRGPERMAAWVERARRDGGGSTT